MAYQKGVLGRNAELNGLGNQLGATSTLKAFSGVESANCGAADPAGTLLTISLPASPFGAAAAGVMAKAGTWSGAASAAGTIASWRIYDSSAVCQHQGNTTDMTFDNTVVANGQVVTVNNFSITAGNS